MEVDSIAQIYAAKFLTKDDAEQVAEELYKIMENSIKYDSYEKQESTKEFLIKVIQLVNDVDQNYADKISKAYLGVTLGKYMSSITKK